MSVGSSQNRTKSAVIAHAAATKNTAVPIAAPLLSIHKG